MTMKYNKEAALRVVQSMETYEDDIMTSTRDIYSASKDSSGWKDKKHADFCRELSSVIQDIKNGAYTIRDYKNHLNQKIQELE